MRFSDFKVGTRLSFGFVMLLLITIAVGGPETSMLGRRAFAVHDVRPDHGGTVEFVFEVRGPGTRWLASLRARDVLDTVGPLGRPFPIPRDPLSCLLLGVGYGSASMFAFLKVV